MSIKALSHLRVVADDEASGRPAQAFVGAHGHEMSPFRKWVWPRPARDHSTEVGGIEEEFCADLVSNRPRLLDRMRKEIEAAADGDEFWLHAPGKLAQSIKIDREVFHIDRRFVNFQAIESRSARHVVRHVATNA